MGGGERFAATGTRCYELRIYTAAKGKPNELNKRSRNHTTKLFEKHGMTNVGYRTPTDTDQVADNMLYYFLTHRSPEAAKAAFDLFRNDPEWVATRKASEVKGGGSLTTSVESIFMWPTDYSPAR